MGVLACCCQEEEYEFDWAHTNFDWARTNFDWARTNFDWARTNFNWEPSAAVHGNTIQNIVCLIVDPIKWPGRMLDCIV